MFAGSYRAAIVRERLRGTVSPRSVKHPRQRHADQRIGTAREPGPDPGEGHRDRSRSWWCAKARWSPSCLRNASQAGQAKEARAVRRRHRGHVRTENLTRTYDIIESEDALPITASKLRENVYRILDEAIETGKPVEVVRKGTVLTIVPPKRVSKLATLKKRPGLFVGDVEDIIHIDWSKEWTELR